MDSALVTRRRPLAMRWVRWVLWAYVAFIFFYLFLPSAVVTLQSFNENKIAVFPIESFSLQWWAKMFHNDSIWTAFKNSIIVALPTTLLATLLGVLAAYALVRYRFRFKNAFTYMLMVAMVIPYLVVGIALLSFWSMLGVERGLHTVILAHVALALPYSTLVIAARLQGFDISLEEAGQTLGASRLTVFRRISLPLLMPGILAGAAMAFTISFDEFAVTYFVIGAGNNTLPIMIYSSLHFGITPEINATSTIILGASMLLMTLTLRRL